MPASPYKFDPRISLPENVGERLSVLTVKTPIAPLHRKPSHRSGQDTQLIFGHQFDVYKISKGWAWGQARSPVTGARQKGYVGYIPSKCLEDNPGQPTHLITALKAPVFIASDIKSQIVQLLPLGALVKVLGGDSNFLQMRGGGYLHRNHLLKMSEAPERADYVSVAEAHIGLPYVWGGISSDGLDCSGLVLSSLRAVGQDAPRDADMMQAGLGCNLPVSQRGLKRGDLVFWKGHVGIMQSAKQMIHANAFHMKVESEPLREAVSRIKNSGGGPMIAIKRL